MRRRDPQGLVNIALSGVQPRRPPRGWGQDPLTAYLDEVRDNQFASFANKEGPVGDLIRIDGLFMKLLHGAVNPQPFAPMLFMLRAHSAYRAAAGAVMAGQLYEAQAMLRLCLEHGAYGFYIGTDPDRWERWLRRNESEAYKQAVRKEFTYKKIKQYIKSAAPRLGHQFEMLYEQAIDFGAHPNEPGFSLNARIRREDGSTHYETLYLQGDGELIDLILRTTGQVGLWVLHLMQLLYRARYELLGIHAELEEIRSRF